MNNKFIGIESIQVNHVVNQETLNEYLKKNINIDLWQKKLKSMIGGIFIIYIRGGSRIE